VLGDGGGDDEGLVRVPGLLAECEAIECEDLWVIIEMDYPICLYKRAGNGE